MPDLASELARCPVLSGLAREELVQVAAVSRAIRVRAGELLFREGQTCEGFYLVDQGSVRVYKLSPEGRDRTLHVVTAGQSFAEAAMFGSGVYPAFAEAIEDSRVILVRREPFVRMLRSQPDTCLRMFESLSRWLRRLLDQLESETFLNARSKLANFLLREARRTSAEGKGCRVELKQPKKTIASQLGMAPETFSRALADLESLAVIERKGRRMTIRDVSAMEHLLLHGSVEKPL